MRVSLKNQVKHLSDAEVVSGELSSIVLTDCLWCFKAGISNFYSV
jgi:hypothetical protein